MQKIYWSLTDQENVNTVVGKEKVHQIHNIITENQLDASDIGCSNISIENTDFMTRDQMLAKIHHRSSHRSRDSKKRIGALNTKE